MEEFEIAADSGRRHRWPRDLRGIRGRAGDAPIVPPVPPPAESVQITQPPVRAPRHFNLREGMIIRRTGAREIQIKSVLVGVGLAVVGKRRAAQAVCHVPALLLVGVKYFLEQGDESGNDADQIFPVIETVLIGVDRLPRFLQQQLGAILEFFVHHVPFRRETRGKG